jgi:predicted DNA-binding transcriptional regulator YafY
VSQRLERLVNLTATLLDTRRPLTLDELAERLEPSYPDDKNARRRAFERDKETMRDLGIPISVESLDALGGEVGYCIHPATTTSPSSTSPPTSAPPCTWR